MNRTCVVACLSGASLIAANASAIDWNDPPAVARAAADVSPSLAALKFQIAAARERIIPAGSLPNPMVMGGVQNQQVDLSIDRMMTMYWAGASQTLTRRSKRVAQRTEAELEVRRFEHEYESVRAEVERDALLAYYQAHPDDARKLIQVGESRPDTSLDPAALAAWTMLTNELFNLDEVLNK